MMPLVVVICAVVPAALLLAGHYFPWVTLLGRPLRRLEAYTVGVAVIVGVPSALILYARAAPELTPVVCVALYWLAALAAGLATTAAYGLDWAVERYHHLQDRVDRAEYDR